MGAERSMKKPEVMVPVTERPVSTQLSLGRVGAARCRRTWLKHQAKRESCVFNH